MTTQLTALHESACGSSETNGDDARMSACRGKSGHRADSSKGPTLTLTGLKQSAFAAMHGPDLLYLAHGLWPWGTSHEATRPHRAHRRRSGGVAAGCAGAAAGDAGG